MVRRIEGITEDLRLRATPDEAQMVADIAALLSYKSANRAMRWAIRYAWQHATSTGGHATECTGNSPCAAARRALGAPDLRRKQPTVPDGQTVISHEATVEEK